MIHPVTDQLHSAREILSERGPLRAQLPGFRVRPPQQAMAEAITHALEEKIDLLVEAGTGTGKTLAYLVPAILSGMKVIISTGTKNLQDQLRHRDVPMLRQAMRMPVSVSMLKGRANYFCVQRHEMALQEPTLDTRQHALLRKLALWSAKTRSGDIAECDELPENDPFWMRVTSTVDNCLGQTCAQYEKCFLVKARREAQASDIVIINHHLLLSDMALQQSGFGELLPAADAYIIDEAHQLPDIASNFFGIGLSSAQCADLAGDSAQFYRSEINEDSAFYKLTDLVSLNSQQLRAVFGPELRRAPWQSVMQSKQITTALTELKVSLEQLKQALGMLSQRNENLAACHERCLTLADRLANFTNGNVSGQVYWFETHRRSVSLHVTPLDIAVPFSEHKAKKQGVWIFTSATLTVAGDFSHFTSRLGLHHARCLHWDSPFDYQQNTRLFLPSGMPEPNDSTYTRAVVILSQRVFQYSRGRAFILFTSHRALQEAARLLRDTIQFPLFVQGDASRDTLLEKFRASGNGVLFGTSSFWEGVDVRGEALSCVIIDKLPFATPDDPVLQARIEVMRSRGQNPFMGYQLPTAVIALKQGAGRLIRDFDDRGVLVVCDPRIRTKPYGRVFLKSLPPMPITHDERDVQTFFTNAPLSVAENS